MGRIDETRRVSRLLDIAWRIAAAPRHWTRKRLAAHYEVSERQITSDLTVMRHGLHWQVQTSHTGYYFDPVPAVPGVQFTLPEALALLLAVRASMALPGVGSVELTAAIARLASLVPPQIQALVALPESPTSPREQTLRTLQLALGQRRRVHLTYETASRGGAITERDFDPYAIFPYGRSWHVIGYCHLRDAIRDFKADRIAAVAPRVTLYEIPAEFNVADFLGAGWGLMRDTGEPAQDVILRFSALAGRWVREERWHTTQEITDEPDGHIRFTVRTPLTPEFRRWVFHYGSEVEVLLPQSLRDWMRTEAETVAARYAAETGAEHVRD
ncbi:MAG: WYL domain-containing protein [Chloroflexota bacterium]|nr:WYL domain-containing protein [Chloroflexota bacterium]